MENKKPTSFKLILALTLTGLLSGVVLSGIYALTAPTIKRNKAEATRKAVFAVLPGTTQLEMYQIEGDQIVAFKGKDGEIPGEGAIFMGLDDQNVQIGFAIPAAGPGFMDTIKVIYGYVPNEEKVVGLQVLESRETPGLGDKIEKDPDFVNSFKQLKATPQIDLVKKGPITADNQVDGISGATISSDAVVKILNTSLTKVPKNFPSNPNQEQP